ncbi:MAG: 4-hydroxythreonine-4-phosphate dehydrogenase PdxA [Ignavibacteriae bacterium]|nr:MAG: 4-hydroxythreonine-4-phosphate dehydrogenase PdxA [Ignavibacteriota bacterium]
MNTFVFTCGDINGIGPEIVIKTINKKTPSSRRKIIFIIPKNVFEASKEKIKPKFKFQIKKTLPKKWEKDEVIILDIGNYTQKIGRPTKASGKAAYEAIIKACELLKNKSADAMITAPISKIALQKADINFPGHTELIANYFSVKNFSMMFVSNRMKAGLVTIHEPINNISKLLTKEKLQNVINVIDYALKNDFGIPSPKIAVLGLNPHAGENGKIGKEEVEVIQPVIKKKSRNVFGPFVPDAFFGTKNYNNYDCIVGIYHDQLLIPFKLLNFSTGVNYTAGLPIIRTSPDHGTAYDIAGKGIAEENSTLHAFNFAVKIARNRRR